MQKAVKLLADENTEFQKQLRDALKTGLSFPAARKQALSGFLTEEESSILDKPNNILGIEYLKALKAKNSSIEPVIVKREGQGYHGQELSHGFASASGIRSALKDVGDWEQHEKISQLFHVMPKEITEIFIEAGKQNQMVWEDDFSLLLQYNLLKQKNRLQLTAYSDVSKDLAMRISKNLNQFESYSSFVQKLKTKELTYTRISRALLHILLGDNSGRDSNVSTQSLYSNFRIQAGQQRSVRKNEKSKRNSGTYEDFELSKRVGKHSKRSV